MSSLNWYLNRLRAMDVAEIFGRLRERVRHQTERFALPAWDDMGIGPASGEVPKLPDKRDASSCLKHVLAEDAARLLAGKWKLYGWNEVQVPSPPDWHRDYVRGISVPVEGGMLNHRALPGGADVRNIWEINRWAEPLRLAMHGWLNDDEDAIQQSQGWLADWVKKNPPGQGINWSSALEGGLRMINFCWFDGIVSQMGDEGSEIGLRQSTLRNQIVRVHVWWVRRYLSFGSSANNHRLGELTGLMLAVKRWPELEKIAGSAEELWKQISECVLAQFTEDGGNMEQALHYHLFAFEMALHACRAMNVTEGAVFERLQKAAEFFVRFSHPHEPWDYGDSDDAQIVPLTMRREKAGAEWSAWMSGRGTGLQPAEAGDEEVAGIDFWLGRWGREIDPGQNARATHRLQACATGWWIAPESGLAVIEREGWKVRIDGSPLGFGKMAAHGHCDALHVTIWDGEHALMIDPGTGGYFGSMELRTELASWNAHNGPQPAEGFKTPRRMGAFLWTDHHARPVLTSENDSLQIKLEHEGVQLIRTVRINGGLVMIEDSISKRDAIRARWTFAPELEVNRIDKGVSLSRDGNDWRLETNANVTVKPATASRLFGASESCATMEVTGSHKIMYSISRGLASSPELQLGKSCNIHEAHELKPMTAFTNT